MKLYYEARSKTSLIRRTPVIIRLDGKAIRSSWRIDNEIPIFVEEGRNYIEKLI